MAEKDENISETRLPATRAIRGLNTRLAKEPGIEVCMLPIGDGLTMVQKQ